MSNDSEQVVVTQADRAIKVLRSAVLIDPAEATDRQWTDLFCAAVNVLPHLPLAPSNPETMGEGKVAGGEEHPCWSDTMQGLSHRSYSHDGLMTCDRCGIPLDKNKKALTRPPAVDRKAVLEDTEQAAFIAGYRAAHMVPDAYDSTSAAKEAWEGYRLVSRALAQQETNDDE